MAVEVEKELAQSLKIAGKLMTAGSMIILHRAQAFGNARLFMDEPHCGIPAFNTKDAAGGLPLSHPSEAAEAGLEEEALWYRSKQREGSPADSNATSSLAGVGGSRTTTTTAAAAGGMMSGPGTGTASSSAATHSTALSSFPPSVAGGAASAASSMSSCKPGSAAVGPSSTASAVAGGAPASASSSMMTTTTTTTTTTVPAKIFFPPDDRYMGGPFDAKLSLQRCKLAAAVMHETLVKLERGKRCELALATAENTRRLSLTPTPGATPSLAGLDLAPSGSNNLGTGDSALASASAQSMMSLLKTPRGEATPRVPPYSACSYVLSAYVWLMLSLLALLGNDDREQAAQQIGLLRSRARSIHGVLGRMAASWRNASEYRAEVETLLLANERLAG
ncbi:hypothetical protein OC835_007523 [Tilletia horrida]|nr:hypothetical protein OC835_007523 [Tilletia horrida]